MYVVRVKTVRFAFKTILVWRSPVFVLARDYYVYELSSEVLSTIILRFSTNILENVKSNYKSGRISELGPVSSGRILHAPMC